MKTIIIAALCLISVLPAFAQMPTHRMEYSPYSSKTDEDKSFDVEINDIIELKKDVEIYKNFNFGAINSKCGLYLKNNATPGTIVKAGRYSAVRLQSEGFSLMYGGYRQRGVIRLDHPIIQEIVCASDNAFSNLFKPQAPSGIKIAKWLGDEARFLERDEQVTIINP
jgi:hypothetical protein